MITGKDLIAAGVKPGKWFPAALQAAEQVVADGGSLDEAIAAARSFEPRHLPLRAPDETPFHVNIRADGEQEEANVRTCLATMRALMRTPTVTAGALMPDACPAGPIGTIPVGGIVASEAIHPGMHSADICCSMTLSTFPGADPAALLDAVQSVTHFGPGGRQGRDLVPLPDGLGAAIEAHPLLKRCLPYAVSHFATQGDGNHFAFVGRLKSSGETTLVTHHGSRGFGAMLYKIGMTMAEAVRARVSPETGWMNAWIPADTEEGDRYWSALQLVRDWTKANHFAIHDRTARAIKATVGDRFWNEHNFVFRKPDGLFYHAKGATPAFPGWAADATDLTIIPMNMAEPILVTRGSNAPHGLGFAPHGAGRNFSRTEHRRLMEGRAPKAVVDAETGGIDARFFLGRPDISELPSAYKSAASVRAQIAAFGLAEIVDEVVPHGSIMAGDWASDAPWRKRKADKLARAAKKDAKAERREERRGRR